jgi:hypothetical protein
MGPVIRELDGFINRFIPAMERCRMGSGFEVVKRAQRRRDRDHGRKIA